MAQHTRRFLGRGMAVLLVPACVVAQAGMPARAAASGSNATNHLPTWWAKYQIVSASGFTPKGSPRTSPGISVGANVDVSNEPGPQSETAIAIDPGNLGSIIAGSNEIDRLPMRGYWDNATGGNGKTASSNGVLLSRSTDGGLNFSPPVSVTGTNNGPASVIAADPFVGPDGTLYVAWDDIQNSRIAVSSSTDGGSSFGPSRTIAATQATYEVAMPAMSVRQALIYPACGADTGSGTRRGSLYCSWMDETGANGTDIFVSHTTDSGTTWSPPLRVNDDTTGVANDQFNQWLAVDPADGSVNMSWNDTRNDPTHLSTDIYFARSTNGAGSFGSNIKVTTAPTNETCCGAELFDQYGDYAGIAALNGSIHPIWTDRRADVAALDEEVFTATLTVK